MKNKINVFVYGTLLKRNPNHFYLSGQKFIGKAVLQGYAMYQVRSYPGIIPAEADKHDRILGELYEIDEQTLKKLDRLEGEGYLYKRLCEKVSIDNTEYDAYIYVWLDSVEGRLKISFEDMPWRPFKVRCI